MGSDTADEHAREEHERGHDPAFDRWARGYGAIRHDVETQARVIDLAERLGSDAGRGDGIPLFELLLAADRVASAAMWLVVHETYARHVYLDGRALQRDDFKPIPEGHTGGSLNMVPAYVGYLAANAVSGFTRAWVMGQGHCVAAIDSVNLFADNMTKAHAARYSLDDAGLTRYVRDFYSYRLGADGRQDSPLGSHVNAHTAGGIVEGGYLGFTELQYVHMPLPGERLVAFLSDGAFEEQRGSDWAPRWWRAADSGLSLPIMINNGRRIDQRTTLAQTGGTDWFVRHLELNGFDPIVVDGRDPAAFTWLILEMEERLVAAGQAADAGRARYPVALPYGVAVAPKGAGFYGEGQNLAHNLPLGANPAEEREAADRFNEHATVLWVPEPELRAARASFGRHDYSGRPSEREHPLANRHVELAAEPPLDLVAVSPDPNDPGQWQRVSPMRAIDETFAATVRANPRLRPRVGNPDEMRSNRMLVTLDELGFRVTDPEPGIPEHLHGAVVTALNEEAVAAAALANKGGINIVVTYEAFGMKMHGVMRQEIIFSGHCARAGREQRWLSMPFVMTSHAWENAKNEQSHQDPALVETMLGEWSDVARAVFPMDHNTAAVVTREVYRTHGQIWTIVAPKTPVPSLFSGDTASRLVEDGAIRVPWAGHAVERQEVVLTAVGAFQLEQVLLASRRLSGRDVAHSVIAMLEPGRFRAPRTDGEAAHGVSVDVRRTLYPDDVDARVFVTHTRPEPLLGVLAPLNTGHGRTAALGYVSRGGTLDVPGLLFLNGSTWAHVVAATARVTDRPLDAVLTGQERAALRGEVTPEGVIVPVREPSPDR